MNYPHVIEVVIPLPIDNTFDYLVSEAEYKLIKVGFRVVVSFGSKKLYTGIVLNKSKNKNIEYDLKEIKFIVDDIACVSQSQINFFKWISQYYMCPLGNVFESALPKSFLIKSESVLIAKNKFIDDNISEKSIKILEKINEKNEIILKDLSKLFDNSIINNVNELIYKEYIEIKEEVFSSYSQKFQNFYSINSSIEIKSLKLRSDKQKKLWIILFKTVTFKIT